VVPQVDAPKPAVVEHLLPPEGPVVLQPTQNLRFTVPEVVCVTVENVTVEPPVATGAALHRTSMLPAPAGAAHVPVARE
jgi:hypothetical protein